MIELSPTVQEFIDQVVNGKIEIYNEFSLQHELGIFLRNRYPLYLIQFERNVSHFGGAGKQFTKKEIDISIYSQSETGPRLELAIELKFPNKGQYPEQMFSFCKDIKFAEELVGLGFRRAAALTLVCDPLFHSGNCEGIYSHFRGCVPIEGVIQKPTGPKDEKIQLEHSHNINWLHHDHWHPHEDRSLSYYLVEVEAPSLP